MLGVNSNSNIKLAPLQLDTSVVKVMPNEPAIKNPNIAIDNSSYKYMNVLELVKGKIGSKVSWVGEYKNNPVTLYKEYMRDGQYEGKEIFYFRSNDKVELNDIVEFPCDCPFNKTMYQAKVVNVIENINFNK